MPKRDDTNARRPGSGKAVPHKDIDKNIDKNTAEDSADNGDMTNKGDVTTERWWPSAVVAGFGVVWLAATLVSVRGLLSGYNRQQLTLIAPVAVVMSLSILLVGAILFGVGAGLAGRVLSARRGGYDRLVARLAFTCGAGVVAGAVSAGAVYAALGGIPANPVVIAMVTGATALVSSTLAAVRLGVVVAAGMAGTAGMLVALFVVGLFTSPLSRLLGGEKTLAEVALGHERLALAGSLVAGLIAGYLAYRTLQQATRAGQLPGTGIAAHLVAGGTAGLVSLCAEALTFATTSAVVADPAAVAAGGVSAADELALSLATRGRVNGALIVAFTGAIAAIVALGRTRGRTKGPDRREEALKAYEQRQRAVKQHDTDEATTNKDSGPNTDNRAPRRNGAAPKSGQSSSKKRKK